MDELIKNIERVYLEKFILKGVDFKIVKSSKLPSKLIGDYNRVLQILTNIIENAYKYTNKGEVILKINLDYRRAKAIRVRFSVEDTGVGFVKEHNTKFESFKKHHKEDFSGSGLGLSIVTNLIQLMNGSFTFDSILNEGSVFIVNLPFNIELESDNLKKKTPKFSKIDIKVKYNVLITDDNEINQLVLTKLLLNHGGFYIDLANNGKHAIEMATKEKYDLIFMDLQMPIMNGFEAIEILNNDKETKNTKIIALSAFDTVQDQEIGKKLNVDDYVVKPFSKEELFSSIYKVLKINKESIN
jgi:CheY-like chemotaxis protein/anti-sigma regulatory factor (Ser/Thr protein kinase)